jgi:hypothetical protein
MCFFLSLLLLGPRFVLFIWWLVNPVMWNAVFDTWLLPVLGIVFLPWTTLMFVFLGPGGITGFEWLWMALGVAADFFSYTGGAVGGRGRVGSYY